LSIVNNPVSPVTVDGRSSRWTAHRAARREELIDAAVIAIGRHGASVGMDQLAAIARTSKPVIYRYFLD
jgi:AcrR family transcriptional regulator